MNEARSLGHSLTAWSCHPETKDLVFFPIGHSQTSFTTFVNLDFSVRLPTLCLGISPSCLPGICQYLTNRPKPGRRQMASYSSPLTFRDMQISLLSYLRCSTAAHGVLYLTLPVLIVIRFDDILMTLSSVPSLNASDGVDPMAHQRCFFVSPFLTTVCLPVWFHG